jgi:hypothetical protein
MSDFNWKGDYYKSGDMPVYLSIISQRIYESKKITNSDILEYGWERSFKSSVKVNSAIKSVPRYRADVQMVYSNEVTYGYTFENNNSKLPSCMVMHDSFGTQIFDILAERMDTTYYPYMWDYTYDNSYVNSEKPDYVIYIVAEWNLDSIVYK